MAGKSQSSTHRKMQKVPPLLLEEEKNKNDYIPKVVSLGPYHHKDQKLAAVEAFKPVAVDFFVSNKSKEFYRNHILKIIDDIRNYYEQESTAIFSNEDLAEMMLRDAAFVINYLEIAAKYPSAARIAKVFVEQLGKLTVAILTRDLFLLENQIPLRVVKLLIELRDGPDQAEKLLDRSMNNLIFRDRRERTSSTQDSLHLLEAFHTLVASNYTKKTSCLCFKCRWFCSFSCCSRTLLCCSGDKEEPDPESGVVRPKNPNRGWIRLAKNLVTCSKTRNNDDDAKKHNHSFRTVTDLMAKGIHFRPSPTQSLKDVKFKSRFFYARLELPKWVVSNTTKVFFLNLVAYELSPNNTSPAVVAAYIKLMKSLIDGPGDVKELRERKIFYNMLGSDEEVVNVYRDIKTYGAYNQALFRHVKDEIQSHYNSRIKTWIAELIHTHFRSPWTIMAFLAAVALLGISAGQLYYAVHPNN